ncbi:MAG: 4Fe-4S binding protein [Deltaproteobacteria bacterium]|nr:4Fe-4S binding protein [Candidatus Zymogenaceae bacterium]
MTDDIYRKLQRRLNNYSLGFPETQSGVELEILKLLFSEEDAELFLGLSHALETPESVANRLGMDGDTTARRLKEMAKSGLLFRLEKKGEVKYGAIPFVHGLFEFRVKNLTPEMARLVDRYYQEGFFRAVGESAEYFLRTVPVMESIPAGQRIASYEDAAAIIKSKDLIVVTDCICRKLQDTLGKGCGKVMEACFMFGSMAQYYLDHNLGRKIDADEALSILQRAREDGLVTQPATSRNPSGMCNCCGDCCGVLSSIKQFPKPAEMVISNHRAAVDPDDCTGCGVCIDRCQMEAIVLSEGSDAARVDEDRCIGCGLCVTDCPTGAAALHLRPEAQLRALPADTSEQFFSMAKKRGLV